MGLVFSPWGWFYVIEVLDHFHQAHVAGLALNFFWPSVLRLVSVLHCLFEYPGQDVSLSLWQLGALPQEMAARVWSAISHAQKAKVFWVFGCFGWRGGSESLYCGSRSLVWSSAWRGSCRETSVVLWSLVVIHSVHHGVGTFQFVEQCLASIQD